MGHQILFYLCRIKFELKRGEVVKYHDLDCRLETLKLKHCGQEMKLHEMHSTSNRIQK